jgi:hypothetical protein
MGWLSAGPYCGCTDVAQKGPVVPCQGLLKGIATLRVNLLGVPATFVTLSIDDYDLTPAPSIAIPELPV